MARWYWKRMQFQSKRKISSRALFCGVAGVLFWLAVPARGQVAGLDEARAHHRAGRLEQAAAGYREALGRDGLDQASRAVAANNLCVILDARGELESAEEACRTALEIRRESEDRLREARTLNNLGLVLQHRGRYRESEKTFTEALAINQGLGEALAQAINLANLGAVATLSGRFQDALDRHAAVTELARAHFEEPWASEQLRIAELNRAVVLEKLGSYREALEMYRSLLAEKPGLSREEEASILVNSGVIYRNLGDPVQAIERFEAAAAAYEEMGNRAGLAHAVLNIGIARHLNLGDVAGARASYLRALELVGESGDQALGIEILGFLGRLLLANDRSEEARGRFEEALALALESGSAEGEWLALAGLGATERVQGNLEAALDRFEGAIALIEEGRSEVARFEYRASFLADKRAVYSEALDTLAALEASPDLEDRERSGLAGRALELAQRAKSRDLLDALGLLRASEEPRAAPMTPLSGSEIGHRLGEDVLIEYFVTDTDLLMWWSESDSMRLARLGDPRPVLDAVDAAYRALSNGEEPPGDLIDQISATLLGPLAGSLDSLAVGSAWFEERRTLWIAPDRRLHYLPFEILSLPGDDSERRSVRLIERAQVAYLPSAWALPDAAKPGRSTDVDPGFVAFGGVGPDRDSAYPSWVSRLDLEPLRAARGELETVAKRLGGKGRIYFASEATEESFRSAAARSIGVMHFATHTALVDRRGGGTAILLTPTAADDGMLSPAEVADNVVGANLVVLAACTTAPGGGENGSALSNLTGAFLAAGSQAVLATLWPVADQPTAVFMDQFYFRLAKGVAPVEALRQTKLRFMSEESWRSPAFWSGYVLVGSSPPVVERRFAWMWIGALALAVAVGLAIWRIRAPKGMIWRL